MDSYTVFAEIYDEFMEDIPYESWTQYIISLLKDFSVEKGIVLELGCGTGRITKLLASHGFDMIGIDSSEEMLRIASEAKEFYEKDILYLNQDMREFELYGTVAAVISVCDTLNYITEYEELVQVFKLVNNYLDPKGVFIFDLKTKKYFKDMGDYVYAENKEDTSLIWENAYFEEECLNEYELTIFKKDRSTNQYEKYTEYHYQKAFTIEEVKRAIEESGMEYIAAYKAFCKEKADESNDRIYMVARERGKAVS